MSSPVDTSMPRSYTDFTGLGELRGKAQKDQNSALRESAQQFEGLFIQMMLKSMREANAPMKDEDHQSQAMDTFEGMFDKEVSLQMSKRGALGVADFMERAVKQQQAPAPSTETTRTPGRDGATVTVTTTSDAVTNPPRCYRPISS